MTANFVQSFKVSRASALLVGFWGHGRRGLDFEWRIHSEQSGLAIQELGEGPASLNAGLPGFDGHRDGRFATALDHGLDFDLAVDMRDDLFDCVIEQLQGLLAFAGAWS